MAFATVVSKATGSTTANAATHSVNFPAGITNDEVLMVCFGSDGAPVLVDNEGRWTKIDGQEGNGGLVTGCVFAKIADGNDGLTVRTPGTNEQASWVSFRIANHGGLPVAVSANGSSTNSNPPAITPPWGTQDYLFIAARMGDANVGATGAPSGYSNLTGVTHANTAGASVHTAEKSANASTEDPGTFTSATEQWATFTIAVPPAGITTPKLWAKYYVELDDGGSLATPSFTPVENEKIVVKILTSDADWTFTDPTGGGLTYTSRGSFTTAQFTRGGLYTAEVGAGPSSMTVSTTIAPASGPEPSMVVERWRDAKFDATPAVNSPTSGTSGAPSSTITTEANDSVVSWMNGDWQAIAPGAYAYRGTHTVEDGMDDETTTFYAGYYAYTYAPTAGAQTIGLSAPAGQKWTLLAVEIQYQAPPAAVADTTKFFLSAAA